MHVVPLHLQDLRIMSCLSTKDKSEMVWAYLQALKLMYFKLHPNETCVDIVLEKDSISIFEHSNDDEEVRKDGKSTNRHKYSR